MFIFTYHHARYEGWVAIHNAIRQSGFVCTQTYPIKAEMSVAMPLTQAKSPIHLDLIIICRKSCPDLSVSTESYNIEMALLKAQEQMAELVRLDIKLSDGDAKVILMGQFLRYIHTLGNMAEEEKSLEHSRERYK